MVNKAIKSEHDMNALEADNRKRAAPSSYGGSSQRARTGPTPAPRVPGYGAPQPMWMARRPPAPQGQVQRSMGQLGGGGGIVPRGPCYNCGGQGHYSWECPSPKKVELVMFQISPLLLNPTAKATKMDKLSSEAG